jgi:hypothetical protein
MNRNRVRLGTIMLAAAAALAMLALPGIAAAKDRNHDRIPDRWEKRHHLSLQVKQTHRDQDSDHLRNRAEFMAGDNPRDRDSDDDGVADGEENAGTIASFDTQTGRLVINLFNGDTLAGTVTDQTEIKCEDEDEDEDLGATASHDGQEAGDDNGGQGEEESGDDRGDNSGPGSEHSGPGHDGDDDGDVNCTTAALVPDAVVEEAELEIGNGTATFEEVELAG